MALGGGVFLTQNKKLPGSYIRFISGSTTGTGTRKSSSKRAAITMSIDSDGNLYVTYNRNVPITFELDSDGGLYANFDSVSGTTFEIDSRGNMYMIE